MMDGGLESRINRLETLMKQQQRQLAELTSLCSELGRRIAALEAKDK
jgi:uncharacterized coiled-coil protein SlyX